MRVSSPAGKRIISLRSPRNTKGLLLLKSSRFGPPQPEKVQGKIKRRERSRSCLVVRRPFPAGIHSPGSGGGSGRPLSCRLLFRFVHKGVRKSTDEYRHICISAEYSALLLLFFFLPHFGLTPLHPLPLPPILPQR